jgi:hypothetical protein
MIIVPLLDLPFGVAQLSKSHRDGSVEYQWWGNSTYNVHQPFYPGWISGVNMGGQPIIYYRDQKRKPEDQPYHGHIDTPMTQRDIVAHSFEMTGAGKLPAVILKATDEDYRVKWTLKTDSATLDTKARKPVKNRKGGTKPRKPRKQAQEVPNNTQLEPPYDDQKANQPGPKATNNTQLEPPYDDQKANQPGTKATNNTQLEPPYDEQKADKPDTKTTNNTQLADVGRPMEGKESPEPFFGPQDGKKDVTPPPSGKGTTSSKRKRTKPLKLRGTDDDGPTNRREEVAKIGRRGQASHKQQGHRGNA